MDWGFLGYLPLSGIGVSAVVIGLERLWPARRERGQPSLNVGLWAFRHVNQILAIPVVASASVAFARQAGLPSLHSREWPLAWAVIAFFLAMDMAEYLFHRAQHAVPLLWRMHSLHHSDPCMNALTTERHFWGDAYLRALFISPVIAVVLAPPGLAIGLYSLFGVYNVFVHANLPVSFGRLSWFLNSPAYHRIHHSKQPEHHGANFAALFPIWDVVAGSYRRPTASPETGLDGRSPRSLLDMLLWPVLGSRRRATTPQPA
jgi:sterol desaturase/sphingolipid hydroxylase (fatty acid hydroxylase superfamily)